MKAIFMLATTMAIAMVALTQSTSYHKQTHDINLGGTEDTTNQVQLPSKRVSRFLAQITKEKNRGNGPRGRGRGKGNDHCHKNPKVCKLEYGVNYKCCGNKCIDISNDKQNCGVCHKKCKFTYSCCNGRCVDLAYDKRHCGNCNNKCFKGKYCFYGMCDYA